MTRGTRSWTWTWLCILGVTHTLASNEWLVGEHDPVCQHARPTLFCDYQGKPEDVRLTQPLNATIQKVFIHNVQKLRISDTLCVNVSLTNVADVVVVKGDPEAPHCEVPMEFLAQKCKLDLLPRHASNVYLEESEVTSLITSTRITRLTVLTSHVQNLNVGQPLESEAKATFIQSNVKKVEMLQMNVNSSLLVQDSTLADVQPGGLVLRGGDITLKRSRVSTMTHDSVLLGAEAFLTLEDLSGILKVKVEEQPAAPCKPCLLVNTYLAAFIICLVLLCLALLLVAYLLTENGMNLKEKVNNTMSRVNMRRTGGNTTRVDIENREEVDGGNDENKTKMDLGKGSDGERENSQNDKCKTVVTITDCKFEETPLHKTYREGREKILVNIEDIHKQTKGVIEQMKTNKVETLKTIEEQFTIINQIKEDKRKEMMFLADLTLSTTAASYLLYETKGLRTNLATVINFKDAIDLRIRNCRSELNRTREIYNHNQKYIKQLMESNEDETDVSNEGPANTDATAGAILKNLKKLRLQIQNQSLLNDEREYSIPDTSKTFNEEPEQSLESILNSRDDLIFNQFLPDKNKTKFIKNNHILYHVIKGIETISKEMESEYDLHCLGEEQSKLKMLITEQERIIDKLVLIDTIIGWLLPARQQKPPKSPQEDTEITPLLQQTDEQRQHPDAV